MNAPGIMVITTDTIVEGVHYLENTPPELVARKLIRVNVSDLAAKGARPAFYTLNATFNGKATEYWIAAFSEGLRQDQRKFGLKLMGGDTTKSNGCMVFGLTAFGEASKPVKRRGAKPGDYVYVTGSIGDSFLGLKIEEFKSRTPDLPDWVKSLTRSEYFVRRYQLPEPRILVGMHLDRIATAACDVSDGLIADLGHICEQSEVAAIVMAAEIPISVQAGRLIKSGVFHLSDFITHGDDYEIVFTSPREKAPMVAELARFAEVNITRIGEIVTGKGVLVLDDTGRPVTLRKKGYEHFSASVSEPANL